MSKTAVVVLAEGFETIEALTPVDVLRRAGAEVRLLGLTAEPVRSAQGVWVLTDGALDAYPDTPDLLVLPGGLPGADHLAAAPAVAALLARITAAGGLRAAICAAPARVLAPLGALSGRRATCYPGFEVELPADAEYVSAQVVEDGPVITSRGPGTALAFSLRLAARLMGPEIAERVGRQMLATP